MLQASQEINARVFAEFGIAQSVGRSVNQGGGAAPIFVGSICQKKLRRILGFDRSVEETACFSCIRVGLRQIREGKKVSGKENAGERLSVPRGLRKPMVETAAARARDVSNDAVHHLAALLVGVKVLVKKVPQKTAALRNANSVDALYGRGGLRLIL